MKRTLVFLLLLAMLLPVGQAFATEDTDVNEATLVTSEMNEMKSGDKGEGVRALQTRLKDVRYYPGKVTGNYLNQTVAAVKKVQEAYGLPVTGDADRATLEVIFGDCHRPLAKGDEGKDVARLQTRLSELGYYTGKVSGRYIDGTAAAVSAFQKLNGLDSTGKADVATQQKLYDVSAEMPTPDPDATPAPTPAPTEVPDKTFPGRLSYGSKGKAVRQLQEQLKWLGYFDRAKTTEGFYKHTHAAVETFQKQNGLKANGIVDETTWNALYAEDAARPGDAPKPSPEPTPPPYYIEVDVENQLVKVFSRDESGEYTNHVRTMWCSTGTAAFPSDVGRHVLTGRRARWAEFPNWGGGKAQYWLKVTDSVAFHSVLYSANDSKAVNMKSVGKLGRRASHGCIRLTLQDAKWLYMNAGAGTVVNIYEGAPKDPELKAASKPGTYSKKLYAHPITPEPEPMPAYDPARPPEGDMRTLKTGVKGADVYWLQMKLKELGFYSGTATGTFLEGTKAAVIAYQRANGLKASGAADTRTLEKLYADTLAAHAESVPTPLPTDEPMPAPTGTPAPTGSPAPDMTPAPKDEAGESA